MTSDDLRSLALSRPRVRVNQLGYLVNGPKHATVITDAGSPIPFQVRDHESKTVFESLTVPHADDAVFRAHRLDFTAVAPPGSYTIECDDMVSVQFQVGSALYTGLLEDATRFFYLQRSGIAVSDEEAPGYARPAGHVGVEPNRGDTAVQRWRGPDAEALYPGWEFDATVDVSGGWYDAGDHGKYVVCGGLSATMLLSAYERLQAGGRVTDRTSTRLLDEAMWEVDWMLRMQVPEGEQHAGLAFHRVHDDHWTDLPMFPHDDPALRVLHRPSTAAGLNLAAAAAQAARNVPTRRHELLAAAQLAYAAAIREPTLYAPQDHGAHGGGPYNDDDVTDEFYWAATELFLSTGDERYETDIHQSPHHHRDVFDTDGFDWDTVAGFARLQLALHAHSLRDIDRVRASVIAAADRLIAIEQDQAWGQPYAPDDGWDWGSNGRILSNLIVIATAARLDPARRFVDGVLSGIDYLLGRNPVGLSFVTGYGTNFSHRQRTRHFAHALDPAYPPPPIGAVCGGPASKTYPGFPGDDRFDTLPPQLCYVDEPTSETTNDVCIRWNSSLVLATAHIVDTARTSE